MAKVRDHIREVFDGASSTLEIDLTRLNYQDDDCILIVATNDTGLTEITIDGSWAQHTTQVRTAGSRSAVFERVASGVVPNPTLSGDNTRWIANVYSIQDVNTTTRIDAIARSEASSTNTATCPDLTTTENDCCILRVATGWDIGNAYAMPSQTIQTFDHALLPDTRFLSGVSAQSLKKSAGSVGTFDFNFSHTDGGSCFTIALKNSVGGVVPSNVSGGLSHIERFGLFPDTRGGMPTATTLGASVATIDGISVETSTSFGETDKLITNHAAQYTGTEFPFGINGETWQGVTFDVTEDLSNGLLLVNLGVVSLSRGGSRGRLLVVFDSAGNWSAFNHSLDFGNSTTEVYPIIVSPSSTAIDSSGTLDWSDVVKVGIGWHRKSLNASSFGPVVTNITKIAPYIFTGGNAAGPIRPSDIHKTVVQELTSGLSSLQGGSQFMPSVSIQIGDGTNETHYNGEGQPITYPDLSAQRDWQVGPDSVEIRICASSDDDIDLAGQVINTSNRQAFVIDASSSALATYNLQASFTGPWAVTDNVGLTWGNDSFSGCDQVDGKAGTFSNCTFKSSTGTISALKLSNGGSATSCTFTKGVESYAIELENAGSYDLSSSTFSGYTKPLKVSAASGTVTITLATGQSQPTYDSDGATVVFVQPQSIGSVTNIVSGSQMQIYNETTGQEVINQQVNSDLYTVNYNDGSGYSNGDTGRLRLTYANGTVAKLGFEQRFTVGPTGWSVLADQKDDSIYNSFGLDGSTITKFSADYADSEVDIVTATNFLGSELYARFVYFTTTEQGIRLFFGAITAEDSTNLKNDVSILNLFLDNNTSSNVWQTDNIRIYKSNGVYPVKNPTTGGGGIDVVWRERVFGFNTGGSGLTPSESAQLFAISTDTSEQQADVFLNRTV